MSDSPTFTVDLFPTGDKGTYHVKNAPGGEIQRKNLVDRGSANVVQGDLVQVLHGTIAPEGAPASLIVIDFRFYSLKQARRFKSATVVLHFADEDHRVNQDPEVIDIAPNGNFSINPTQQKVEIKRSAYLAASGGGAGASATAGFRWELTNSLEKQDQTTLTGTIRLEGRDYGLKNTARWDLMENTTQKSSIPTNLRTAILVKRRNYDKFAMAIQVKAEVDFISSIESLLGRVPKDDPVIFDPNYEPTGEGFELDNLGNHVLRELSHVVSTETLNHTVIGS